MTVNPVRFSSTLLFNRQPRLVVYDRMRKTSSIEQSRDLKHPWEGQSITPRVLVRMLFYFNQRKGFTLTRNFQSYLREAKRLISLVGQSHSEKLMTLAYEKAGHPWGIKFLEKLRMDRPEDFEKPSGGDPIIICGVEI